VVSGEGSMWDTGGGAHCWNHKFQCGIVFHGHMFYPGRKHMSAAAISNLVKVRPPHKFRGDSFFYQGIFFSREETFVTPVVAAVVASTCPRSQLRGSGRRRKHKIQGDSFSPGGNIVTPWLQPLFVK